MFGYLFTGDGDSGVDPIMPNTNERKGDTQRKSLKKRMVQQQQQQ